MSEPSTAITGLRLRTGVGYSFHHPRDWHDAGWADGRQGELLLPDAADRATLFALETVALAAPWDDDDLPLAADELHAVIGDLDGAVAEELDTKATGPLRAISARFTFTEDGVTRQRWVRILVQGRRQLTVTAQGASPERYAHWAGQLFTTMMTVRVHRGGTAPDPRTLL